MDDKPFAGDVAPELLRNAPCDLLLVPRPSEDPAPEHIVFAFEPEQKEDAELLRRAVEVLRPQTIAVTERPFAPAIAALRAGATSVPQQNATRSDGIDARFES